MVDSREGEDLERALDSFLEWAKNENVDDLIDDLPSPQLTQRIGTGSILDEFQLGRRLGSGGMGVVYEAVQRSRPGRRVAVKVLRNLFGSTRLKERFRREIEATSSLDHPGIVPIIASDVENGVPFYAMDFVEGASAEFLIRGLLARNAVTPEASEAYSIIARSTEHPTSGTDVDSLWHPSYAHWVARVGALAARALHHAHERGVVHRDVKPANLMITPTGRPVLLDFGLANRTEDGSLTKSGDFLGTLAYVSPEQARGQHTDRRSDVYSLGATLYELLSLRRPFDATTHPELLRRIEGDEIDALDAWIPIDLCTIVQRALAKDPSARYPCAATFAKDLEAFASGHTIDAKRPGLAQRAARGVRRHWGAFAAALALAATAVFAQDQLERRGAASDAVARGDAFLARTSAAHDDLRAIAGAEPARADWRLAGTYPRRSPEDAEHFATLRGTVERGFRDARTSYLEAFEHVRDHAPARRALAELFAEELRAALLDDADILAPGVVARIEADLARYDDGTHAELLDRRASIVIESRPGGARIEIVRDDGSDRTVFVGTEPVSLEVLVEGSYVAVMSLAGHAPTRYPFVVRRGACPPRDTPGPSNTHVVELARDVDVPRGFVHVPAGWSLCRESPPRWEFVESFAIQRYEITFANWLALRNRSSAHLNPPRDTYDPTRAFARADPTSGEWVLAAEQQAHWPVLGLSRTDMGEYYTSLQRLQPPASGAYYSLPTRAEWVRAARGADARTYPWGDVFDWSLCAGYPSHATAGDDDPFPIGHSHGDVSPFGVHDLAGSATEATMAPFPAVAGDFLFCGGSFRDTLPERMAIASTTSVLNQPRPDAGFRLVARPLPAWVHRVPTADTFFDDFERPDSDVIGADWVAQASHPLATRSDPNMHDFARIEDGRLVLIGGRDHHSEHALAMHTLPARASGFVVRATMRATLRLPRYASVRNFGIQLSSDLLPSASNVGLMMSFAGESMLHSGHGTDRAPIGLADPSAELEFELRVLADSIEGRIWESTGERPDAPTHSTPRRDDPSSRPYRILVLTGPNLVGGRVEIDAIEVSALPEADASDFDPAFGPRLPQDADNGQDRTATASDAK